MRVRMGAIAKREHGRNLCKEHVRRVRRSGQQERDDITRRITRKEQIKQNPVSRNTGSCAERTSVNTLHSDAGTIFAPPANVRTRDPPPPRKPGPLYPVSVNTEKKRPQSTSPRPGQLRGMVFQGCGENAYLVQPIPVKTHILGVHMKKTVGEGSQRTQVVHLLPDHMRRIEIQPEPVAGNVLEHAAPDGRTVRKILAPRPFVLREKHGAVLDCNAHVVLLCKGHKRLPHSQKPGPLLLNGADRGRAPRRYSRDLPREEPQRG